MDDNPIERRRRRGRGAITLREVASAAGVSPMTVSRVIGNNPRVNHEMRERVMAAIKAVGYSPNTAAQSLARSEYFTIGMLHSNPSASFSNQLLVSLFEQSSILGCRPVLARLPNPDRPEAAIEELLRAHVDGVILSMPLGDDTSLHARFRAAGIATVALGTGRTDLGQPAVRIDNIGAARAMTDHLIALGHSEIGFICGATAQVDAQQRLKGFLDAMHDAGIAVPASRIVQGDYSYRSGFEAAGELLAHDPPTAIFASNDDMAAGALAAAHKIGLEVPRQISLVGFDDTSLAHVIWPALTTIRQPTDELATKSLTLLIEEIRDRRRGKKSQPRSASVELTLIRRESDLPPTTA